MSNRQLPVRDQRGIVSIIVTMLMMVVITLLVLTYSQIIRREQRQTLDRQLSSQAFYAAESAVNATNKAINTALASGTSPDTLVKANCAAALPVWLLSPTDYSPAIPSGTGFNLSASCLLVDPNPYALIYSSIGRDTSQNAHIKLKPPGPPITRLEISWDGPSPTPVYTSASNFPPLATWAATSTAPVLRIDLIEGPSFDMNNLYTNNQVYFLYPCTSASCPAPGVSAVADKLGSIVKGSCTIGALPAACKATISVSPGTEFFMRIRPIYTNASVTITPFNAPGNPVQLTEGQIIIDVTGRSADVLKRINVRRNVDSPILTPGFAIDSMESICKKLSTDPTITTDTCGLNP